MNIISFLKKDGSLIKTLYFNFRVLPFKSAIRFPFAIGKRVEFINLKYVKIRLEDNNNRVPFGIRIGINNNPIASTKDQWTLLRFEKGAQWILGNDIYIKCGSSVCIYNGAILKFSNDIQMNQRTRIYCKNNIEICSNVGIGWDCQIYDTSFHFVYDSGKNTIKNPFGKIRIGSHCWIANHCTISGTAKLPDYSILSSGSLLNKDYSCVTSVGNLFVGCPAKIKDVGLYRIFNKKLERYLFGYFRSHREDSGLIPDNDFDIMEYQSTL